MMLETHIFWIYICDNWTLLLYISDEADIDVDDADADADDKIIIHHMDDHWSLISFKN